MLLDMRFKALRLSLATLISQVAWLEQYLKEFQGTVVAVTHDRYFMENVAGWILELDRGKGVACWNIF